MGCAVARSNRQGTAAFAPAQSRVTGQRSRCEQVAASASNTLYFGLGSGRGVPKREQKGEIAHRRGPGGKTVARERTLGVQAENEINLA
jgi:hypothetical protein